MSFGIFYNFQIFFKRYWSDSVLPVPPPGDAAADRAVAGVLSRGAASAVVAVAVGLLGSSSCCWRCCNCGCWDGGRLEEARPLQLKINNLLIRRVVNPDPVGSSTVIWIRKYLFRIQAKIKKQINNQLLLFGFNCPENTL